MPTTQQVVVAARLRTNEPSTGIDVAEPDPRYGPCVALDPDAPHVILPTAGGAALGKVMLFVTNTGEEDTSVTFEAGDDPPAVDAPLGPLTVTVPAASSVAIVLDPARFTQSRSWIASFTVAAGATGYAYAIQLP